MNKLASNLWFIHIATSNDQDDFSNWLNGKMVTCRDTIEFRDWLEAYKAFPLDIYLNGVLYHFRDRRDASFFLLGYEAAREH